MTIKVPILVTFTVEVEDAEFEAMREDLGVDDAVAVFQERCGVALRDAVNLDNELADNTDSIDINVDEWAHSPSW